MKTFNFLELQKFLCWWFSNDFSNVQWHTQWFCFG